VVPELADYLPGPFASAGAIVGFFSTLVAPFPYEKLAHVQSFTRYGGMENASAIFYSHDLFQHRNVSTGIIAHETAHQWFGDAVTPASWAHLWLSEGFASYFEQLWIEKSEGEEAFRRGMRRLRDEIAASDVTYMRPVIDTTQDDYVKLLNTNSYQKGAWTLHMLRTRLGDSVFFGGIRNYYSLHRHANATSDDLCESFERVSHEKLRWFFDEWLRRPGIPEITIEWSYDQGRSQLSLAVEQDSRTPPYQFPLTIEIHALRGETKTLTVEVPASNLAHVSVPVDLIARPVSLVFDPTVQLLAIFKMK
jgi:aminopeptidase N